MLWGPFWFIRDVAGFNVLCGIALLAIITGAVIAGALNVPRLWAFALIALAIILWLLTGIVGEGIGC
jgi:hypothetical protein